MTCDDHDRLKKTCDHLMKATKLLQWTRNVPGDMRADLKRIHSAYEELWLEEFRRKEH